jgi:tRNA(Ile)-lysidine synthase
MTNITAQIFAGKLNELGPFEDEPIFAVAVSGGADSLALTLLCHDYATSLGGKIIALTIDHALRVDSAKEAAEVNKLLLAHNIEHHILNWDHAAKPESNIQSKARQARYDLLTNYCKQQNILHLLVAHHRDDQAETFLMRLERGSGVEGLSSIRLVSSYNKVRILRPLLSIEALVLKQYLQHRNIVWIEDPSNLNKQFTRIKIREYLNNNDKLITSRLCDTVTSMQRANNSISKSTYDLMVRAVKISPLGFGEISIKDFIIADEEQALRTLSALITTISGSNYPPRFDSIKKIYDDIMNNSLRTISTLGHCKIIHNKSKHKNNKLVICKELPKHEVREPLKFNQTTIFDNRFLITFKGNAIILDDNNMTIGYLGKQSWSEICRINPIFNDININKEVIYTLPSIRILDKVVAVPYIDYYENEATKIYINCYFKPTRPLTKTLLDNSGRAHEINREANHV